VKAGDELHLLNMGGVIGCCTGHHSSLGDAIKLEVKGLVCDEDGRVLKPAVEAMRGRGVEISGPYPGDTVFVRASRGEFDAVIACYHDQGLIPVKLLAFGESVNVTLGLPIIRTSVDHGTAFDIAGKGVADPSSMIAATLLAARLAGSR